MPTFTIYEVISSVDVPKTNSHTDILLAFQLVQTLKVEQLYFTISPWTVPKLLGFSFFLPAVLSMTFQIEFHIQFPNGRICHCDCGSLCVTILGSTWQSIQDRKENLITIYSWTIAKIIAFRSKEAWQKTHREPGRNKFKWTQCHTRGSKQRTWLLLCRKSCWYPHKHDPCDLFWEQGQP